MILTLGSGDTGKLLQGLSTKGFGDVLRKFVAHEREHWNSFASPIDALRTGAILERNYLNTLGDDYFAQTKVTCQEFDCMTASLDFAKMYLGTVIHFDELKTIFFTEFIDRIVPMMEMTRAEEMAYVKKKFKGNYNQVQFQLLASGLNEANLVFLSVESYDDEENKARVLTPADYYKIKITRDIEVIEKIKKRVRLFQDIKDFVTEKNK